MDLLVIGLLAALELSLAMPAIVAMKSQLEIAVIVMASSACFGSFLVIRYSARIHAWILSKFGTEPSWYLRTQKFMSKYGTVGTGLLAPLVLGPALTSISAIVLGAKPKQLMIWIFAGIWLWSAVFYFGISAVTSSNTPIM